MEAIPSPANSSGEREARAISPLPLHEWGPGVSPPEIFFKIADARRCVLIHFQAPKLIISYRTFMGKIFFVSLGVKKTKIISISVFEHVLFDRSNVRIE